MNPPRQSAAPEALHTHELIGRCLRGERGAFRKLVEEHQQYVFALAFRALHDDEDARDVVQETFVRVWKHLPAYDMKTKFTTWLYVITANLAYDLIKSNTRRRRRLLDFTTAREENSAGAIEEEENIANRDLAAKIRQMAGDLPPKQRLVFVLRDLQDLSVEEVAEILSMSPGAVKANLCYARRFIRARLEQREAIGSTTP